MGKKENKIERIEDDLLVSFWGGHSCPIEIRGKHVKRLEKLLIEILSNQKKLGIFTGSHMFHVLTGGEEYIQKIKVDVAIKEKRLDFYTDIECIYNIKENGQLSSKIPRIEYYHQNPNPKELSLGEAREMCKKYHPKAKLGYGWAPNPPG